MACNIISKGIKRSCRDNIGGLRRVYIANADDIKLITIDNASVIGFDVNEIDDLSGGTTTKVFYQFTPIQDSSNADGNVNSSVENGVTAFEHVVNLTFGKMSKELNTIFYELSTGDFVVIAEDKLGNHFLYGTKDDPIFNQGGGTATGTGMTDLNGVKLELKTSLVTPPAFVTLGDTVLNVELVGTVFDKKTMVSDITLN